MGDKNSWVIVWVVVGYLNSSDSYDGTDSSIEGIFTSESRAKELCEKLNSNLISDTHYDIFSTQNSTKDTTLKHTNQRKFLRSIYFERKLDRVDPVLLEY